MGINDHCPNCNYPDGPGDNHYKGIYDPGKKCSGCGETQTVAPEDLKALATGSALVWEKSLEARANNPVFKARKTIMRGIERALIELEMSWIREDMGDTLVRGRVMIDMEGKNTGSVMCEPRFNFLIGSDQ